MTHLNLQILQVLLIKIRNLMAISKFYLKENITIQMEIKAIVSVIRLITIYLRITQIFFRISQMIMI